MNDHFALLAILVSSPAVILGIHGCLSRAMKTSARQAVAWYAAIAGYAPVGFLLWFFVFRDGAMGNAAATVYAFIVYTGIAYIYFHLFNTSETARRIRLIYQIYQAGSLPVKEIPHLYNVHTIVELRLQRLVETKHLRLNDGAYTLESRVLYLAAVIVVWWQRVLGISSPVHQEKTPAREE